VTTGGLALAEVFLMSLNGSPLIIPAFAAACSVPTIVGLAICVATGAIIGAVALGIAGYFILKHQKAEMIKFMSDIKQQNTKDITAITDEFAGKSPLRDRIEHLEEQIRSRDTKMAKMKAKIRSRDTIIADMQTRLSALELRSSRSSSRSRSREW